MAIQRLTLVVTMMVVEVLLFAGVVASGMGTIPGAGAGAGLGPGPVAGSPVPMPSESTR